MSSNKNLKLVVRHLQKSDCEEVRQIWTSLGFMASKYDNEVMINVDGEGIFVAQDLNSGRLVGTCSAVNLSPQLAHVGQYGCIKELQNTGIGAQIWGIAMEHIGNDRNVSLYARQVMANKYRDRCNFTVIPDRLQLCYTGKIDFTQLVHTINGISVIPLNENIIEKVIKYDTSICDGLDRTVLIRENTKFDEYVNKVAVNHNNEVLGYCMLKVSNHNTAIVEPLYANDENIAELLLRNCIESMAITQNNGLIYNCWNTNDKSVTIAKKLGLSLKSEFPVLFTKKVVNGDMDRIYCMSSRAFYPF